jgi:hypothetical protein
MDVRESSSVWREAKDPHPHACYERWAYLTYTAYDETVGAEVEKIKAIPCRRCAASENFSSRHLGV